MASLTGEQLKDTYDSLLKVDDNGSLGGTYKEITDGLGNGSNLYLGTGGNVGIGTNSPNAVGSRKTLEIEDLSGTAIRLSESGVDNAFLSYDSTSFFRLSSSDNMTFLTSGTERMRIDSSGNVGIGTDSPTSYTNGTTLEIKGKSSTGAGLLKVTSADGVVSGALYASSSGLTLNAQTNHSLGFSTNNSPRMTIDSSGNVGIGNTSPSSYGKTTIALGAVGGNVLALQKDSGAGIAFYGASFNATGLLESQSASGDMVFYTGTSGLSEKMRIDSSGYLLVSTVDELVYNGTQTGTAIGNGYVFTGRSGDAPIYANRITNDGDVIRIRKDGTTVGSIGTTGGDLYFADATYGGIKPLGDGYAIVPSTNSGADYDNAMSLGASSIRWKDLYLGGNAYIQGDNSTSPAIVINDVEYKFVGNTTKATSTTHTIEIEFDSQTTQWSGNLVEIKFSGCLYNGSAIFGGRALYALTILDSISGVSEIEDSGANVSFATSTSGTTLTITATTTSNTDRYSVIANITRGNKSITTNKPLTMTLS